MKLEDLATEIQTLFPQIYHACHADHVRAASSEAQLSSKDSAILAHLTAEGFDSPSRLAKHLNIGASTLSEGIANLQSLGYVKTMKDGNDERKLKMLLTEKGRDAMRRSSVLDWDKVMTLLSRLSLEERTLAVKGLGILAKAARIAKD